MNVWVELVALTTCLNDENSQVLSAMSKARGFEDFGLTLDESKGVQRRLQEQLTQFQADQAGQLDRRCLECDRLRGIHDYRSRTVHSLFGVCRFMRIEAGGAAGGERSVPISRSALSAWLRGHGGTFKNVLPARREEVYF